MSRRQRRHAPRRVLPLRRRSLQRRGDEPGAVHALPLLGLPQDGEHRGYAINLGADAATLKIRGKHHLGRYHALIPASPASARAARSPERRFCMRCGSAPWPWDPRWPELVHPHASAIDAPLPKAPEVVEAALDFAAPWVDVPRGKGHVGRWPDESLADRHRRHGLRG